jgi:hypothetical protein
MLTYSRSSASSRSLAGIASSYPAGGMDVCLLWVLCCVATADSSSRGVLPGVSVSLCVITYNNRVYLKWLGRNSMD